MSKTLRVDGKWDISMKNVLITTLFFLIATSVSLFIVIPRIKFESNDRSCMLIVDGRELSRAVRGTGTDWSKAAQKLAAAGINGIGVSRLSLNDLEQDKAVTIQTTPIGTPFEGSGGDNLYVLLHPPAKDYFVAQAVSETYSVSQKGDWLRIDASGAFARTAHLFWNRRMVSVMEEAGILPVHRFMNHLLSGEAAELSLVSAVPDGGVVLFDEKHALGWPDRIKEVAKAFKERNARIGLVEFAGQIGVQELIAAGNLDSVIVHSITDKEMVKFSQSKFIPRWLRAVRERRVRALYIRFFPPENPPAGKGNIFERNVSYFSQISQALKMSRYTPGKILNPRHFRFSPDSTLAVTVIRVFIVLATTLCAALFLYLSRLFPIDGAVHLTLIVGILGAVIVGSGVTFTHLKIIALVLGVLTPATAILVYLRLLESVAKFSMKNYCLCVALGLFAVTTISVAAGMAIHGLLNCPDVLLKLQLFSGVKLVYLVPPVAVMIIGVMDLKFRPDLEPVTWLHVIIGAVGLAGGALYIMRSGNFSPLPATAFEHFVRDALDLSLPVRPRTKEFLVGYPCLILLAVAIRSKQKEWGLLLSVAGTVAAVSVVNSFCHLTCSPFLNVIRSYLSLVFSILPGLLFIPVFLLFRRIPGRSIVLVGYYGYGNAGDDAILKTLIDIIRPTLKPGDEIVVPVNGKRVAEMADIFGVKTVSRFCPWSVIPELVRCRLLIYGGGGLFQDKTGYLTIPYYALYAGFCRLVCTEKMVMLSQGIGDISSSFLAAQTAHVANLCDFVQVRDVQSADRLLEMGAVHVSSGTDAFLWSCGDRSSSSETRVSSADEGKVIGVSLRPDEHLDDAKIGLIASSISAAASVNRASVLLLSFYPAEDTELLKKVGSLIDSSIDVGLKEVSFDEMTQWAQKCSVVLGMRYHALLSAIVSHVPVIGLSYASKTANIFESTSYDLWRKIEDLGSEDPFITDSLNAVFKNPGTIRSEVAKLNKKVMINVSMAKEEAIAEIKGKN